jgi:hypothetical protein
MDLTPAVFYVLPRRFQLVERGAVYLTAEALQMRLRPRRIAR